MVTMAMITKDSLTHYGEEVLSRVLSSSLQVPYKTFLLVDDSRDKTAEFIKKFIEESGREFILLHSNVPKPTRGIARQSAIDFFLQNTSDQWIMFLDDDVILRDGWWDEARGYMEDSRVGLIWGVELAEEWKDRLRYLQIRGVDPVEYSIQQFEIRGGLHDTLIRRVAIEGIKIPPWLNVYEDAWIKKYVECKGFEYRIVRTGAIHLRREGSSRYSREDFEKAVEVDAMLKLQKISWFSVFKTLFGLPAYIYYGFRSGVNGLEMWRSKVMYRLKWKIASRKYREEPCKILLKYSGD
ncbi:MAG: glycosyltransferase family 2 protein [Infirmifilum sp.]